MAGELNVSMDQVGSDLQQYALAQQQQGLQLGRPGTLNTGAMDPVTAQVLFPTLPPPSPLPAFGIQAPSPVFGMNDPLYFQRSEMSGVMGQQYVAEMEERQKLETARWAATTVFTGLAAWGLGPVGGIAAGFGAAPLMDALGLWKYDNDPVFNLEDVTKASAADQLFTAMYRSTSGYGRGQRGLSFDVTAEAIDQAYGRVRDLGFQGIEMGRIAPMLAQSGFLERAVGGRGGLDDPQALADAMVSAMTTIRDTMRDVSLSLEESAQTMLRASSMVRSTDQVAMSDATRRLGTSASLISQLTGGTIEESYTNYIDPLMQAMRPYMPEGLGPDSAITSAMGIAQMGSDMGGRVGMSIDAVGGASWAGAQQVQAIQYWLGPQGSRQMARMLDMNEGGFREGAWDNIASGRRFGEDALASFDNTGDRWEAEYWARRTMATTPQLQAEATAAMYGQVIGTIDRDTDSYAGLIGGISYTLGVTDAEAIALRNQSVSSRSVGSNIINMFNSEEALRTQRLTQLGNNAAANERELRQLARWTYAGGEDAQNAAGGVVSDWARGGITLTEISGAGGSPAIVGSLATYAEAVVGKEDDMSVDYAGLTGYLARSMQDPAVAEAYWSRYGSGETPYQDASSALASYLEGIGLGGANTTLGFGEYVANQQFRDRSSMLTYNVNNLFDSSPRLRSLINTMTGRVFDISMYSESAQREFLSRASIRGEYVDELIRANVEIQGDAARNLPLSSDSEETLRRQYMPGQAELGWAAAIRNIDRTPGMEGILGGVATAERAAMDEATYATISLGEMWGADGPTREFSEQGSPQERAYSNLVQEMGGSITGKLQAEYDSYVRANSEADPWAVSAHMQNYIAGEVYGESYSGIDDPIQRQAVNTAIYNWNSDIGTRSDANIEGARTAAVAASGAYENALTGARTMSTSRANQIQTAYRTYGLTSPEDIANFEAYAMLRFQRESGVIDAAGQEALEELQANLPDEALDNYHQIMGMAGTSRTEQIQNISGVALQRSVAQIAGRQYDAAGFSYGGQTGASAVEMALLDYRQGNGAGEYRGQGNNEFLRALASGTLTTEELDAQFRSGMFAGATPTQSNADKYSEFYESHTMGSRGAPTFVQGEVSIASESMGTLAGMIAAAANGEAPTTTPVSRAGLKPWEE